MKSFTFFRWVGLALLLYFYAGFVTAQQFGNEWIVPGQTYVKATVSKAGIYRISGSAMQVAGLPVGSLAQVQIFHRGQEISALSRTSEEIVFYATGNDGAQDSLLYRPFSARPSPYQSIFSDETAYYFTIGTAAPLSVKYTEMPVNEALMPEPYHLQTEVKSFRDEYSFNTALGLTPNLMQSFYERGESWTGKTILADSLVRFPILLTNWIQENAPAPRLDVLINGRANFSHQIQVSVGNERKIASLAFYGFDHRLISDTLSRADMGVNGSTQLAVQSPLKQPAERYSVTFYRVTYPQRWDMQGKKEAIFTLPAGSQALVRIQIENVPATARLYDLTDPEHPISVAAKVQNGRLEGMISRNGPAARRLYCTAEPSANLSLQPVSFQSFAPQDFDYLIVTNESLFSAAQEYADYRASEPGGSFRPLVVKMPELYEQFNYGEVSPLAIRRFADFMLSQGDSTKYLLLIGRSATFPERLQKNMPGEVPTFGYPGSDILLVDGLAGQKENSPAMPVGRINATSPQQLRNYLQKVRDFEQNAPTQSSSKRILHLSGGQSAFEIRAIREMLSSLSPIAENGFLGAEVIPFSKQNVVEIEKVNIAPQVNEGVGMITFFGHASPTVTDLDMGFASAAENGFRNSGRYPFMFFNGCGVGNIFSRFETLSSDWALAADKGAVAVIAHSFWSYFQPTSTYLTELYTALFSDPQTSNLSIGQIQQVLSQRITSRAHGAYDIANLHQMVLQGDPALRLFNLSKPDFSLNSTQSIFIRSQHLNQTIGESDSLLVGAIVSNKGRFVVGQRLTVQATLRSENGQERTYEQAFPTFPLRDTLLIKIGGGQALESIQVVLDPKHELDELSEENNTAELRIAWPEAAQENSFPTGFVNDQLAPWLNVRFDGRTIRQGERVSNEPIIEIMLQDENMLSATDTSLVDVLIKRCPTCAFERIAFSSSFLSLERSENRKIFYQFKPGFLAENTYELRVSGRDMRGNESESYQISFVVSEADAPFTVVVSPNPASDYVRFEAMALKKSRIQSLEWQIYSATGALLEQHRLPVTRPGINEWFWTPGKGISAGHYFYKVISHWQDGGEEVKTGKLLIAR
ncbi:putative type IX secretion system sortase PorU2 [Arundinibacter roseus]|uniref:Gingipain domain-containing protein n=1 Tax=Arundinibacter roseus TaxID=2070510 RepID=A0A4R4KGI4_9BACT|nr:C25 family cysteine peptidase [Arundinibacter roseus]TDB66042.1 hypothetical protein EZE20_09790 [Arundinibacter roseus]